MKNEYFIFDFLCVLLFGSLLRLFMLKNHFRDTNRIMETGYYTVLMVALIYKWNSFLLVVQRILWTLMFDALRIFWMT